MIMDSEDLRQRSSLKQQDTDVDFEKQIPPLSLSDEKIDVSSTREGDVESSTDGSSESTEVLKTERDIATHVIRFEIIAIRLGRFEKFID